MIIINPSSSFSGEIIVKTATSCSFIPRKIYVLKCRSNVRKRTLKRAYTMYIKLFVPKTLVCILTQCVLRWEHSNHIKVWTTAARKWFDPNQSSESNNLCILSWISDWMNIRVLLVCFQVFMCRVKWNQPNSKWIIIKHLMCNFYNLLQPAKYFSYNLSTESSSTSDMTRRRILCNWITFCLSPSVLSIQAHCWFPMCIQCSHFYCYGLLNFMMGQPSWG